MSEVLAVRVDADVMRRLDELADERGVRRSDVARAVITDALRDLEDED